MTYHYTPGRVVHCPPVPVCCSLACRYRNTKRSHYKWGQQLKTAVAINPWHYRSSSQPHQCHGLPCLRKGRIPRARIDLNEAGRSSRTPAANVQQIVRSQSYMLEVVMQRTRHDDVAVADADVCSSKDSNAFANFASAWAPAVYQMAYTAACF